MSVSYVKDLDTGERERDSKREKEREREREKERIILVPGGLTVGIRG